MVAVSVLLGGVLIAVQRMIIWPGLVAVEQGEAKEDLDRVIRALKSDLRNLGLITYDWAAWTATYDFMETMSEDYIESNLGIETFKASEINLILFFDSDGALFWSQMCLLDSDEPVPVDLSAADLDQLRWEFQGRGGPSEPATSVVSTHWGPMLAAGHPILHNDDSGPSRGTMVMGRLFDEAARSDLSDRTGVAFNLWPTDPSTLTAERKALLADLGSSTEMILQEIGPDMLGVSALLLNESGEAPFVVTAEVPRHLTPRVHDLILLADNTMIVAGALVITLTLLMLGWTITDPLRRLTSHIDETGARGDLTARLNVQRRDEIGVLAQAFDRMLSQLSEARDNLTEQALLYQRAITKTGAVPYHLDNINTRYSFIGEGFEALTGFRADEITPMQFWNSVSEIQRMGQVWDMSYTETADLLATHTIENWHADYKFQKKDGSEVWLSDTSVPMFDSEGNLIAMLGILTDITDRRRAEQEIIDVTSRVQTRVGQDIHDSICQELTGISLKAGVLAARLAEQGLQEAQVIAELEEMLGNVLSEARALAQNLYPVIHEERDLTAVVENHLLKVQRLHGIQCSLVCEGDAKVSDVQASTHVVRIIQEAVNNAVKHADPQSIRVEISAQTGHLLIKVIDDGVGFRNKSGAEGGMGISIMRYRARIIGSTLTIAPVAPSGTEISFRVRKSEENSHDEVSHR